MAKVIVAWCDPCMAHEEQTAGSAFQVALDGQKPVEVDLCERHEKEFLAPLRELLGEAGQPVNVEPVAPTSNSGQEKKQCPVCSETRLLTREGLRGHMRKLHGYERQAANDVVRTIFGNERSQKPFSEQCPECAADPGDMTPEEYTYDTPQGLGAHRKAAHGVDGSGRADRPRDAA